MRVPPWLPPGEVVSVPDRGEVFVRYHRHPDPAAPVVLLLHGWTASADTQFLDAYERLAEAYSIVGVDHHGHGRGRRGHDPFDLGLVADDAADVVRSLGIDAVTAVGYSMGGPISMYLARRHPDLVRALVLQATALEWRSGRFERFRWRFVPLLAPVTRAWWYARNVGRGLRVVARHNEAISVWLPWLSSEILRNDPITVVSAGKALSHHDATDWAGSLNVPAASVITTHDRLVPPRKQRALASAVGATVFELPSGHLGALSHPSEFAEATRAAVDSVTRR
jgi:pimeloyl-ACP methyl ester carboxylesterase